MVSVAKAKRIITADRKEREAKNKRIKLAKALIAPLMPRVGTVPAGTKCSCCQSQNVKRTIAGGSYSGTIECKDCGNKETFMSHIGK